MTRDTDRDPGTRALYDAVCARLTGPARRWLDEALDLARDRAAPEPGGRRGPLPAWELRFAAAGRQCRPEPASPPGPPDHGPDGPPAADEPADAVRVLLLHAAGAGPDTLTRLYRRGTAAERRAVLLALPYLPGLGPEAVPLVEDALRANDTRLIAAATGPYAAAHLDPHAWRQAVLKCLFTGVPVAAVAGLASRARGDAELARMLTEYAAERTAAGRRVPAGLYRVLALTAKES